MDSAIGIAKEIAILHGVLADEGEQAPVAYQRRERMDARRAILRRGRDVGDADAEEPGASPSKIRRGGGEVAPGDYR